MKLIVGLGNPGREYEKTRHNIGFIFLDYYLDKLNMLNYMRDGFKSNYIKIDDVIFMKPLTYMNLSGQAISEVVNFYKIKPSDVYVIYDDKDLDFLRVRIRDKGKSGGHNGIKSIIAQIGENFNRIKIGIGSNDKKIDTVSFVLGKFTSDEYDEIVNKKALINDLIDDIRNDMNIDNLKTKYNNK